MPDVDENKGLDPSSWILSYVDFMTVIMAFFIIFVLVATKVASATELFIVKKIEVINNSLNRILKNTGVTVENVGYNGVRIIIPSEVDGKSMFKSGSFHIRNEFKPYLIHLGKAIIDSTEFISAYDEYKDKFKNKHYDPKDLKISVRVEGHTDTDGSAEQNMILSLKRAEGVKNFFTTNNIFEDNIFAICGYGEAKPLVNKLNKDENRRVEIYLNYTMDPIYVFYGCTNPSAYNFNPKANRDDGSCINNF